MAFVYRSQKQSLFDRRKQELVAQQQQAISNEQSQLNGTSYSNSPSNQTSNSPTKIMKGLPSLLKKDKTIYPDLFQFQKENKLFQQNKQAIKFNQQKLKRIAQNYFFSSNVPRDNDPHPFKPLNKSLTCNQFNKPGREQNENVNAKKQFAANHMISTFVVNRSLVDSKSALDFRKASIEVQQKNIQTQKIFIDCSKQKDSEIKRKCSPQSSAKNLFLKKVKSLKQSGIQKVVNDQSQIFMKTLNEQNSISMKRNLSEKKLMKLHKGNFQSSFYKETDSDESQRQEEQSSSNDIPGPGSYNCTVDLKQKKSFRSRKQKFAKIFVSPLERFKTEEVKYQQITYVNQQKAQKTYQNQVFLSKTPKNLQIEIKSSSPPLGTYSPRESMEHDIVKNLLKSSNVPNFNSSLPRFKYPKQNIMPGPGHYNHDILEVARKEQINNQLSSSYKSQVKRCNNTIDFIKQESKKQEKIQILPLKKGGYAVIHRKQQHFESSEFFSPPAFLSGVQRFQHAQLPDYQSGNIRTQHKSSCKEVNSIQPFNSSEKRKLSQNVGQGVGVGSYLIDKDRWNKKSYNVYFH